MSSITLAPNASGTAIFTVAAPNTSTNRTLTLPDATATLATTADVAAAQSVTLLGTLTTTSGATQTLSGLTLTPYTFIVAVLNEVSSTTTSSSSIRISSGFGPYLTAVVASGAYAFSGIVTLDLASQVYTSVTATGITSSSSAVIATGSSGITTASTSITFGSAGGTFDLGSILVYGVK